MKTTTAPQDACLKANELAFRAACAKHGFKKAATAEIFEQDRVRIYIDGKTIQILVFAGAPGHSPVQYSIPIDLWAPAEIAIATLKAVLKTTK
jgi:hypothetical protein